MTDRKLGSTEPEYGLADKVLELGKRAPHICLKGSRLHAKDLFMAIGMAPDLMATLPHLAHKLRIRIGDIAKHKKRRANARFVQHIE